MTNPQSPRVAAVSSHFKLVFLSVLGLTLVVFVTDVALVMALTTPNDQAKSLMDTCTKIVLIGVGAIAGLLGGKL